MAKMEMPRKDQSERLIEALLSPEIRDNPYNFVMYSFPWGEKGTPLQDLKGPREWQKEELLKIADFIDANIARKSRGEDTLVYKCALSSGRGIGKSALVSWIGLWMMSCHLGSSTMVTANTDSQLTNRTFGEIGKWAALLINHYWFERLQKGIVPSDWWGKGVHKARKIDSQLWYIKGELWNEDNPDAFAALHNDRGELVIFDEASGIPAPIWKVVDGIFTEQTPYKFWFCFSNPRSNTGPFYQCFHEHRDYWVTRKIDARTVEGLPKNTYNEIIAKYGADSREAKVEVYGEFPSQGDRQFISRDTVLDARLRDYDRLDDHAALCMGVDPARFGDDSTVIRFRQGRDARSIPPIIMRGADNMAVANKCAELIAQHDPDGIFIDSGAGAGIIDRLKEMGYSIFEVQFGSASGDPQYFDHRTELWARMREWLGGAMIPHAKDSSDPNYKLIEDLVGPEYEFMGREDKIKLESKEKMKKRGLASPDNADALAVTFHCQIARKDWRSSRKNPMRKNRVAHGTGSDVKWD